MIEFSIASLVLLFTMLAIIDFGRILATKVLLTKGAQEAVVLASKIPGLDLDSSKFGDLENPTNEEIMQWNQFVASRDAVLQASNRIPSLMVAPDSFVNYEHEDDFGATIQPEGLNGASVTSAVLLRPGDKHIFSRPNSSETSEIVEHPTVCANGECFISTCSQNFGGDECEDLSRGSLNADYRNALEEHPLVVETKANVRTFLPFIEDVTVTGTAFAFREFPPARGRASAPATLPGSLLPPTDLTPPPAPNPPTPPVTPVPPVNETPTPRPTPPATSPTTSPAPVCPLTRADCSAPDGFVATFDAEACSCGTVPLSNSCPASGPSSASDCGSGFTFSMTPSVFEAICECLPLPTTCRNGLTEAACSTSPNGASCSCEVGS